MFIFSEGGPFRLDEHLGLHANPFSWTHEFHLLVFDSPVGTGFSYSDSGDAGLATTEEQAVIELHRATLAFFQETDIGRRYASNDLYIAGESYAGKYIPRLAALILGTNNTSAAADDGAPPSALAKTLRGIAVGNGLSDPQTQVLAMADFYHAVGFLDLRQSAAIREMQADVVALCEKREWAKASEVYNALTVQVFMWSGMPDPADIRYYGFARLNFTAIVDFVNLPEIRKRLGVGNHTWTAICSSKVAAALTGEMESVRPLFPAILEKIRVLYDNGNFDFTVPTPGVELFLHAIPWKGQEGFYHANTTVWKVAGVTAGYWKSFGPLDFVVVAQAGHMAPRDQPQRCLEMMRTWIGK